MILIEGIVAHLILSLISIIINLKQNNMRNLFMISLAFLGFEVTAQTTEKSQSETPKFNSDAEKKVWIANHAEDYERMTGEKVKNLTPEFKTQAEKDAWIQQSNPKKKEVLTKEQIESSISTEATKDAYLQNQTNTICISQAEINALPEGKKASVLADKNFIIIK